MRSFRAAIVPGIFFAGWGLGACGSSDAGTTAPPVTPVVPVTPVTPTTPSTVTLAPGSSATVAAGGSVSLLGGTTGGEYVLVVADTAVNGSSVASSFQVTAAGVTAAGAVSAPSTSVSPLAQDAGLASAPRLDFSFAANLNARATPVLTPRLAAARRAFSEAAGGSGATFSRSAAPLQVGDVLPLNVSSRACDSITTRTARVVAIGAQSIVVADTLNPAGGFTAADYQRFATRFDTLVYPLDVANFGAPAVFGSSGKILLFFTTAVNALTPKGSTSFVGGFFFSRDLFPVLSTPDLGACAGSNESNVFYLLTPDPTGSVNGNIRRTGFVDSVTTSVLAHEFQHLINASRRIFVNKATVPFETVWLNEGLSHVAEELLFYHEGASAPLRNLDVTAIRASVRLKDAFNADQGSNAGRYREYLLAPSTSSPIRNDDSLSTRGATWDFLRYAADRKNRAGGTDASVWQALVNSSTSGIANLRQVFGSNLGTMLSDWSVSNYADDIVPGVSVDFTQPSWNWHSIYPALGGSPSSPSTYPLKVTGLTTTGASGTVIPGGSSFYRFSVSASATASLGITAGSGGTASPVQGVIVRLR
ncbi:hypothetical protein BH11GEM1_BH11GEM1_08860 [soil metagenome]